MQQDEVVEFLKNLADEQLLAILQKVFTTKRPNQEEDRYNKNRFFLGTASSLLESEHDQPERWGDWNLEAVAYPDPAHYGPDGLGPDWGFCEGGTCDVCHTQVRSNVKHGICPICHSKVYMT